MPSLDIALRFRLDGLSLLFCLIVTGTGFLVTLFASSYLAGHPHTGRFFVYLHAFMLAMLGIVTADNLLLLFVFWEMTTIFSYLLIGFDHESATTRDNAKQALLVTGAGGLSLLVGILLIKTAGGSLTLSHWLASDFQIRQHPLYLAIFTTILLGAMTKSAQVPFHFWLPNAMSAPTPISAFLHAATMVKAGIYLLMRMHPLLGGTPVWMGSLVVIGGITAIWGAIQALSPSDLKRMLAYTTIMALGILVMFLGGNNTASLTAAATFLLVHALYKAALFLAVGSIDHQTGTRLLEKLGGLWRAMPLTTLAVATATMSMAGFPLFFGFIGKEIMYQGALTEEMFPLFATTIALLSNSLMTAVAGIILLGPFTGKRPESLATVVEAPLPMWFGPGIMGGLCLLFGVIPWWVSDNMIQPAVRAFSVVEQEVNLAIFHGFNTPLLLSVVTLTVGGMIYFFRKRVQAAVEGAIDRLPLTGQRCYDISLKWLLVTAHAVADGLQNGSLHRYLLITIGVFALTTAAVWWLNADGWVMWLRSADLPIVALAADCRHGHSRRRGGPRPISHPGGGGPGYGRRWRCPRVPGIRCPGSGTHPVAGGDANPDYCLHCLAAPAVDCWITGHRVGQPMGGWPGGRRDGNRGSRPLHGSYRWPHRSSTDRFFRTQQLYRRPRAQHCQRYPG